MLQETCFRIAAIAAAEVWVSQDTITFPVLATTVLEKIIRHQTVWSR